MILGPSPPNQTLSFDFLFQYKCFKNQKIETTERCFLFIFFCFVEMLCFNCSQDFRKYKYGQETSISKCVQWVLKEQTNFRKYKTVFKKIINKQDLSFFFFQWLKLFSCIFLCFMKGSFGEILKAHWRGTPVAVKRILPSLSEDRLVMWDSFFCL